MEHRNISLFRGYSDTESVETSLEEIVNIIKCDAAEPKSIEELRKAGINAKAAVKGPDSVKFGIQKLQNFKIIYSPDCVNFEHEIKNYCWAKDRQGKQTDSPDHEYSHLMDALSQAQSPTSQSQTALR